MILIIISSVVFLDQATKLFAVKFLQLNSPLPIVKNFFNLTLVYNRGAAFGIFQNRLLVFILISVLAILLVIFNLRNKTNSLIFRVSLSLILGGAIGNLIDRLRFGFVIDFLDFIVWPVFNIADSCITIAAVLLVWEMLFKKNAA